MAFSFQIWFLRPGEDCGCIPAAGVDSGTTPQPKPRPGSEPLSDATRSRFRLACVSLRCGGYRAFRLIALKCDSGSGNIGGLDHYSILFVSALSADAPADTVIAIARQARRNNERTGITGLLVFDGENFAQLMEGPQDTVPALADLMSTDPRHEHMEILHSAPTASARRFPSWRLGYLVMDLQEFGLQSLRGKRGARALDDFYFMLPALDIAVGEAIPNKLNRSPL